jgi:hypothetical protein
MNAFKKLLKFLGLSKELTIDKITAPMAAIVTKLEAFAEEQALEAEAAEKRAQELIEKSKAQNTAASGALSLANRYSALTR